MYEGGKDRQNVKKAQNYSSNKCNKSYLHANIPKRGSATGALEPDQEF